MTVVISSKQMCHKKSSFIISCDKIKPKNFTKKYNASDHKKKIDDKSSSKVFNYKLSQTFRLENICCFLPKYFNPEKCEFVILQKKTVVEISCQFLLQNQMTKKIHV
jgi:hypothetical protein